MTGQDVRTDHLRGTHKTIVDAITSGDLDNDEDINRSLALLNSLTLIALVERLDGVKARME